MIITLTEFVASLPGNTYACASMCEACVYKIVNRKTLFF